MIGRTCSNGATFVQITINRHLNYSYDPISGFYYEGKYFTLGPLDVRKELLK